MEQPAIPENEEERLAALECLHILDTPMQEAFEKITRITRALFQVPIVAFSLIDAQRQWFKSIHGLDTCETSRTFSFCAHTINQDDIFLIQDATLDPRFADNPSVTGEPGIRFYAGYPVCAPTGEKIGSICIADTRPRALTYEALAPLRDIGSIIEFELSAKRISAHQEKIFLELNSAKKAQLIDKLTRLWNRAGLEKLLEYHHIECTKNSGQPFAIAMIDIDNFKKINDTYGHAAGDAVLREVSRELLTSFRDVDSTGRWGGEEFLAIITSGDKEELIKITERACKNVAGHTVIHENNRITVSITIGVALCQRNENIALDRLISAADTALYHGKKSGKNKVVFSEKILQQAAEKAGEST